MKDGMDKFLRIKNPATCGTFYYLDGLVSTGKRNSLHNIKNNFFDLKKNSNIFYAHFIQVVEKGSLPGPSYPESGTRPKPVPESFICSPFFCFCWKPHQHGVSEDCFFIWKKGCVPVQKFLYPPGYSIIERTASIGTGNPGLTEPPPTGSCKWICRNQYFLVGPSQSIWKAHGDDLPKKCFPVFWCRFAENF